MLVISAERRINEFRKYDDAKLMQKKYCTTNENLYLILIWSNKMFQNTANIALQTLIGETDAFCNISISNTSTSVHCADEQGSAKVKTFWIWIWFVMFEFYITLRQNSNVECCSIWYRRCPVEAMKAVTHQHCPSVCHSLKSILSVLVVRILSVFGSSASIISISNVYY